MRGQDGLLIVAFLVPEAEVDFVPRRIAKPYRAEPRAQRPQLGKTVLDGRGGAGVVTGVERDLGALGIVDDGFEPCRQRLGRFGSGKLRHRRQAGVHAIEQRRFFFPHLSGDGSVHELVTATAASAAPPAGHSRQHSHSTRPLTLVHAARVGADLGVGAPQKRIVRRGVD